MAKATKSTKKVSKEVKVVKASTTLTVEQIKERIATHRMAISQSTNESTSVSILALILFIGAPSVFPNVINPYLPSSLKIMQAIILVPSAFWIISLVSNLVRYFMVFKLQKSIFSK